MELIDVVLNKLRENNISIIDVIRTPNMSLEDNEIVVTDKIHIQVASDGSPFVGIWNKVGKDLFERYPEHKNVDSLIAELKGLLDVK